MLRKIGIFLAGSLLTLLLFLTVFASVTVIVFKPNNLKAWLDNSGVYDTLVDSIIDSNTELQKDAEGENIPLNDPMIKAAAEKAFSPEFLQTSAEDAVDAIDEWLNGKTKTPEFSIDVTKAKKAFAEGVGDYALARYKKLPACKTGQIPASTDIFEINCRPPGYDPKPAVAKAVSEVQNNKDFLAEKTITFNTLDENNELRQNVESIPRWYQRARLTPFILGALSIAAILLVVFLSPIRRKGLKRVMISLYFVSGFLVLYSWVMSFAFKKASEELAKSANQNGFQNAGINILKQIQSDINGALLPFIVSFILIAIGISVYLYLTRDKTQDTPQHPETNELPTAKATPQSEKSPKKTKKLVQ